MKKLLLFICFIAGTTSISYAYTPTIGYTYDANGNRTSRYVVSVGPSGVSALKGQPAAEINDGSQTVAIYPNPTKGIFSIGVTGLDSEKENYFMLFDMQGKLLKRQRIASDRTPVDITWDGAGMYLLDVSLGGNVSRWKIVKQ